MKALYKMNFDYGRSGSLQGVFIAESSYVDFLIDNEIAINFGESLGKHSEVIGNCVKEEIQLITEDLGVIAIVKEHDLENGYNPFEYPLAQYTEDFKDESVSDLELLSDWSVEDYIKWKIEGVLPEWICDEVRMELSKGISK